MRKVDLEGTPDAGCVCEESRLNPNLGSVKMAEEGKEQWGAICSFSLTGSIAGPGDQTHDDNLSF